MKIARSIVAALLVAFVVSWSGPLAAQNIKGREMLGIRVGGVATSGSFNAEFGGGSEIELHFIHGLAKWLGVDVSLSSHNFGPSKNEDKNLAFFDRTNVNVQMFSISAGMILLGTVHGRYTPTFEVGPGLYSVNAILPRGFYEAQKTDNHLGMYGGIGVLIRVADTVSLNANVKYHAVFVGTEPEDTVHYYTGESTARFFQIAVGIMIASR
ncbi:MAG: outer membrane beta-barrel protein [Candidatus Krumholzibacteria bacterium]|nr:outer membrane beta-barrel protein [Candidatus Krumholzibacteria bacterium]